MTLSCLLFQVFGAKLAYLKTSVSNNSFDFEHVFVKKMCIPLLVVIPNLQSLHWFNLFLLFIFLNLPFLIAGGWILLSYSLNALICMFVSVYAYCMWPWLRLFSCGVLHPTWDHSRAELSKPTPSSGSGNPEVMTFQSDFTGMAAEWRE